jgi:hypothetical protein
MEGREEAMTVGNQRVSICETTDDDGGFISSFISSAHPESADIPLRFQKP